MDKLDLILDKIKDLRDDNSSDHNGIIRRLDVTNGNVRKNTQFRIEISTTIKNLKWFIGLLGIGNILNLIYMFINH
jgi:hypothetical protein